MNEVIKLLAPLLMSLILLNFAIGVVLEIYIQQTHLFRALQLRAPAASRLQVRIPAMMYNMFFFLTILTLRITCSISPLFYLWYPSFVYLLILSAVVRYPCG